MLPWTTQLEDFVLLNEHSIVNIVKWAYFNIHVLLKSAEQAKPYTQHHAIQIKLD